MVTIMKKILMVLILSFFHTTSAMAVEVNCFAFDIVKDFKSANVAQYVAGAAFSFLVHETGHIIAMEALDVGYNINPTPSFVQRVGAKPSSSDAYKINMAGPTLQLIVNALLRFKSPKSDFVHGYSLMTAAEIISYPLRHGWDSGDFSSNKKVEWTLFSAFAINNLIEIKW